MLPARFPAGLYSYFEAPTFLGRPGRPVTNPTPKHAKEHKLVVEFCDRFGARESSDLCKNYIPFTEAFFTHVLSFPEADRV